MKLWTISLGALTPLPYSWHTIGPRGLIMFLVHRLSPIRYYLQSFTQKQINAFATYAPTLPSSFITLTGNTGTPHVIWNYTTLLAPLRSHTPHDMPTSPANQNYVSSPQGHCLLGLLLPNLKALWLTSPTRRIGNSSGLPLLVYQGFAGTSVLFIRSS